jgi:hypothetical protein
VRPFGDHFFGILQADGQEPKVVALATNVSGEVVLLSLVGYSTSAAAALARLHQGKGLAFQPGPETVWAAPRHLQRLKSSYRLHESHLVGTKERHLLTLSRQADIGYGLLHPPTIPPKQEERPQGMEGLEALAIGDALAIFAGTKPVTALSRAPAPEPALRPPPKKQEPPAPRYVLGNWDEATPHREAFLGHLRAMRVIHLPSWAEALWAAGLEARLIVSLPALGVRSWELTADLERWSALLTAGVQAGWLRSASPAR